MQIRRQDFTTGIPQLIGHTASSLKVSGSSRSGQFEPTIFWLQTHQSKDWYRFFIEAYALHWETYADTEAKAMIAEDLSVSGQQQVKNLHKELRLEKDRIVSIKMDQHLMDESRYGQLRILFESGKKIIVQDYAEEKRSRLIQENP